jgi:hypothetical protein
MAAATFKGKSGFINDIGAVEIIVVSSVVSGGDVSFSAPHTAPVILLGAPSTVTVSAVTPNGCTVDGACTLVVIG